jgi:transcriptional regulator with XRE-family HTH domain
MSSRHLTQAELARLVGANDAQVSRWRRGVVVPRLEALERISVAFGVPRSTLEQLAGADATGRMRPLEPPTDTAELDALIEASRAHAREDFLAVPQSMWPLMLQAETEGRRSVLSVVAIARGAGLPAVPDSQG